VIPVDHDGYQTDGSGCDRCGYAPELMLGHPVVHMPLGSSFPHEPMLLKNIT